MEKQAENSWKQYPMTIEEAVGEVLRHLSEEEKRIIANTPKSSLVVFHFSLGLSIRNLLGIGKYYANWTERPIFDCSDNESTRIIDMLWERLQKCNSD